MDKRYLDILDKIQYLKKAAEDAADRGPYEEFEDKIAIKAVENLIGHLEAAESILEHYSRPTKAGVLREQDNGKFVVEYDYGGESWQLSCGDRLEAFMEEDIENDIELGWNAGQVEYKDGYIFIVPGKATYKMYGGMKVRVRINED